MAKRIELDHAGMEQMLKSAPVRAELRVRAERIKAAAIQISPTGDEADGHYKDRFEILESTTDRARVAILNTSSYSAAVEAKHRPLGRALDAGRD